MGAVPEAEGAWECLEGDVMMWEVRSVSLLGTRVERAIGLLEFWLLP